MHQWCPPVVSVGLELGPWAPPCSSCQAASAQGPGIPWGPCRVSSEGIYFGKGLWHGYQVAAVFSPHCSLISACMSSVSASASPCLRMNSPSSSPKPAPPSVSINSSATVPVAGSRPPSHPQPSRLLTQQASPVSPSCLLTALPCPAGGPSPQPLPSSTMPPGQSWARDPPPQLAGCVTLGKLLQLSESASSAVTRG